MGKRGPPAKTGTPKAVVEARLVYLSVKRFYGLCVHLTCSRAWTNYESGLCEHHKTLAKEARLRFETRAKG